VRVDGAGETTRGDLPSVTRPDGRHATTFVHDYLKDLILDLALAPGTLLTEKDVAVATGLSRTPIREAFLRLHEERLLEVQPRRGALVPRITARQVRELYEVRLLLEFRAAEVICIERIPIEAQLMPLCDEQERLYEAGAPVPELIRVDRRFHATFIAAAGNTVMAMVNESLGDHHQRTGVLSFNLDRTRCATAITQHRAIVMALAGYDLEAARSEIEQHLVRGERDFERLLRD